MITRAKHFATLSLGAVAAFMALSLFGVTPSAVQAQTPTPIPMARSTPCRDIFLLGHPTHVAGAQQLLREINVGTTTNVPRTENDRVFFVISAIDGPTPATREAVQNLPTKLFQWRAILVTDTRRLGDPELQQLVILEMREMLARSGVPRVESIPIFFDDAEHFRFIVHGFRCIP
jgi:hypothetical protein